MNCARGERLINNVCEEFGNLNSIFWLLTEEEMDGMVNIGGRKLLRDNHQWTFEAQNTFWSEVWRWWRDGHQ